MNGIKKWMFGKFLPAYQRESYVEENARLERRAELLEQEIARLKAYIDGVDAGMRSVRKVVVYTGEGNRTKREA